MIFRFVLVFLVGLTLGIFADDLKKWVTPPEQMLAFPVGGIYNPIYGIKECVPANEDEFAVFAAAEATIVSGRSVSGALGMKIAAEKLLGSSFHRRIGEGPQSVSVCVPPEILLRLAPYLEKSLLSGYLQDFQLTLAAKRLSPSKEFVARIAGVAFSNEPHVERSDFAYKSRDLRPKARWVLASFGPPNEANLSLALEAMSSKDSLGTGAAQVAASSGNQAVLSEIEKMMAELLKQTPRSAPIEVEARDRLFELGYALALAGERARPNLRPIHELMSRTVASRSMYGMLGLSPKRMCGVVRVIEGESHANAFDFCADPAYPSAK